MADGMASGVGAHGKFEIPEKGMVPVTVKMVLDDAKLPNSFHQMLYRHVTVRFVGRAIDISNNDESAKFVLDDGTGKVGVMYWFSTPGDVPKNFSGISVGSYVHVVGRMIRKNADLLVQVFSCWPVKDFNDITHHFISTIHSFIVLGGEMVTTKGIDQDSTITKASEKSANCMIDVEVDKQHGGAVDGKTSKFIGITGSVENVQLIESGMDEDIDVCETQELSTQPLGDAALQKSIVSVIKRYQTEEDLEGVSVNEMIKQLGVSEFVLRQALGQLKEIGEIYETVDDDHYGAT